MITAGNLGHFFFFSPIIGLIVATQLVTGQQCLLWSVPQVFLGFSEGSNHIPQSLLGRIGHLCWTSTLQKVTVPALSDPLLSLTWFPKLRRIPPQLPGPQPHLRVPGPSSIPRGSKGVGGFTKRGPRHEPPESLSPKETVVIQFRNNICV